MKIRQQPVGNIILPRKKKAAVIKKLETKWNFSDYAGTVRSYLGIRRKRYNIKPGLYSVGNPNSNSPVLVTANYKMSVDILRKSVKDLDVWIMVLDTKGINVWCAAGKGTFGTKEIINRIKNTDLKNTVSHRKIIVPQLGAPGINPVEVKGKSSFAVIYGPVEAKDIPEFIKNNYKATKEMRRKNFRLLERLAVSLTHLSQGLLISLGIALFFIIADFIFISESRSALINYFTANLLISLLSIFTATILTGLMLPILPGRSFSIKGLSIGIIFSSFSYYYMTLIYPPISFLYNSGKLLILLAWIIYTVLNLTGSSTYTSLSGVMKEMKYSIFPIIAGAAIGIVMIITGAIIS